MADEPPQVDVNKITEEVTSKISQDYETKFKEIEASVEEKAARLADERVAKMKDELISNMTGRKDPKWEWEKKGKTQPESWDQLMSEAEKIAEAKAEEKLKKWKEEQAEESKKRTEESANEIAKRNLRFSSEWMDLVKSGKMPSPSPEILAKLQKREVITEEEARADKGIVEYNRLIRTAQEHNLDSVKIAFYEKFDTQPAGAHAPVFGAGSSGGSLPSEDAYSYEEIHGK